MLNPKVLSSIVQDIHRRFPEVASSQPTVSSVKLPNRPATKGGVLPENYLLTFHGSVTTSTGQIIARWVRVVVNTAGKIQKITTSR